MVRMTSPSTEDRAPQIGPAEAAFIVPAAASLDHMVRHATAWPAPLVDALKRLVAWSLEYAKTSHVDHRHWVVEAESDLREWLTTHVGYVNLDAAPAIEKAYEVAAYVRCAGRPPPRAEDVFDAIERAAAAEVGQTVEAYRAENATDLERWRTRLPVTVVGVDTDTPTLTGVDALTATQLRHLSRELAAKADAKTPPPATPAQQPQSPVRARVAADDMAGPAWTGGMVA